MATRPTPYHVVFQGGFSGYNNPGGRVYYVAASGYTAVDGKGASDSNSGTSPQQPFATVQAGLDACTAGRGDVVSVLPGTYTVTAAITMTKADVTLMSAYPVGPLEYSPVIITAAATLDANVIQMDADHTRLIGIGFECGFTTVTANQEVVQVNSTNTTTDVFGVLIENCFFDMTRAAGAASAADTDLDCIRLGLDANDAAINAIIRGCTIRGYDQDGISVSVGSSGYRIIGNEIYDGVGSDLGRMGVSLLAVDGRVEGNFIMAGTSSSTAGPISVGVAAAQARIHNNRLVAFGADTIGITAIATATMFTSGNFINALAAGNIVDFTTSATTPSSSIDWGNVTNTDPAAPALVTATVDGL